jgi:hypothetical protein
MLVKTSNSFEYFQDFEVIADDKKLILVKKSAKKLFHPTPLFNFVDDQLSNQSIDLALFIRKRR